MQDAPRSVMIFAAGFGTRMMPLTKDKPKPLVEVAGRPLIDRALDIARAVKPDTIVANAHYKADILSGYLGETDVTVIDEQPEILDTGGGLRNAMSQLGKGPVWTLNPDAIWAGPNPLELLLSEWQPHRMEALLLCVPPARALGSESFGDFNIDRSGRLARGQGLIFGGAQIIRTDRLKTVSEKVFSLNLVWDKMIADGACFGLEYPGRWCDVGHPAGIPLASELLKDHDV